MKWFAGFETEFKELDAACKRPHARLQGAFAGAFSTNYVNPYNMSIVVEALSSRSKANLVLGHTDDAMHDLSVIRRLMDVTQSDRSRGFKPIERIQNVDHYLNVVTEGGLEGLWQEPQWIAIQEHLGSLHLLADVAEMIQGSLRATEIHVLEQYPRKKLAQALHINSAPERPLWRTVDGASIMLAPYGWFHQNLLFNSQHLYQPYLDAMDSSHERIDSRRVDQVINIHGASTSEWCPYTSLVWMSSPILKDVVEIASRSQTFVNEAFMACGLERYRRANDAYPKTLEALVPQFASKVPHDLFDGQPLRYRRTNDGRYLLYSIGWNSKDDGGNKGDWVWQGVPKR